MKFKILCILILCAVFFVFFGFVFKNEFQVKTLDKTEETVVSIVKQKDIKKEDTVDVSVKKTEQTTRHKLVKEGGSCNEKKGRFCRKGLNCEEGICIPHLNFKEVIEPDEEREWYRVAKSGPYKKDYILHVNRLVIAGKLYVWVDGKLNWFKARREKELRPYELEVPAGSRIEVKLRRTDEFPKPEFRGRLYLTKPKKK